MFTKPSVLKEEEVTTINGDSRFNDIVANEKCERGETQTL